jgi:chemotaxis protein methyltransferase CheR
VLDDVDEAGLEAAVSLVRRITNVDLSHHPRAALHEGLRKRASHTGSAANLDYLSRLNDDHHECHALIDAIAINTSSFFRDPLCFETIDDIVLRDLITDKERRGGSGLRFWSAGCSSGEEAFSIAMLAREALRRRDLPTWPCLVFGTDIDEGALALARRARYPRGQLANVRLGMLDRYFVTDGEHFEVADAVRETVHLSRADLTNPGCLAPPESVFGDFDMVLCRNVLIYFEAEIRAAVLERLGRTLRRGGYLVLGETEALDPASALLFGAVAQRSRIFRKV